MPWAGVERVEHTVRNEDVSLSLSSKFLNYSNKEAEPPSVTCSERREPNHKYHRSSV